LGNPVFTSKTTQFFADFKSKDSTVRKTARKRIGDVRFMAEDLPAMKDAIASLDPNEKDYLNLKTALIDEVGFLRKQPAVVPYLKALYTAAGDTATLQNEIIYALARQKTSESYSLMKELMMSEPPVFDDASGMRNLFYALSDSFELTKKLFPEILSLNSLDDYKWPIYNLVKEMLDSNKIAATEYESIYNKLYFDAKIELKKMQTRDEKKRATPAITSAVEDVVAAVDEEEDNTNDNSYKPYSARRDDEGYGDDESTDLEIYAALLLPYWERNPNIPIFFNKLLKSKNESISLSTAVLLLKKGKPVADSLIAQLAKNEKNRLNVYDALEEIKRLDLFPAQYKKQTTMAKLILMDRNSSYDKKDSIIYMDIVRPVTYKSVKGNVYFFKYKENKKDPDWLIAMSGTQPSDTSKVNSKRDLVIFTGKPINENKPLKDQIDKLLKEALYEKRKSSASFFGGRGYNYGHNYRY
jgi:hypothetical protein